MLLFSGSLRRLFQFLVGHLADITFSFLSLQNDANKNVPDDGSENDETTEIMEDIQEALTLARRQGVLPPVRIARILAGEGPGQFSSDRVTKGTKKTVPLFVALDYVGTVLEKSRREAFRLKSEIEEYNHLCNSMENEIDSLLRSSNILPAISVDESNSGGVRLSIDNFLAKVKSEEAGGGVDIVSEEVKEAFWREMMQTDDSFDTISRFFAKGVIG